MHRPMKKGEPRPHLDQKIIERKGLFALSKKGLDQKREAGWISSTFFRRGKQSWY